ncbi:MAG: septum site-determining protein MinC [Rhodospirillales bacterium]|nr:MAG: septum site-determining protein MinC [Rhodospirillales bacterium]
MPSAGDEVRQGAGDTVLNGSQGQMSSATRAIPATRRQRMVPELRRGAFPMLVLRMQDPKDQTFYSRLADTLAEVPGLHRYAPVVIDLQDLAEAPPFNLAELGRRLRQHWLVPVGIQNGTEEQNRAAVNAGMSLLTDGPAIDPISPPGGAAVRGEPASPAPDRDEEDEEPLSGPGSRTRLITRPVRSGRQVYAQQGDLVVLASISPGAELLADGHIHVYGALRGRALAGVSGDTTARIFCHSLEAELVSVAGYYRIRDDMPEGLIGRPVQIFLDDERVRIEPLA